MNRKAKRTKRRKRRRVLITCILTGLLITAVVPVVHVYATKESWNDVVYPGVYIEDIDVSGKSMSEVEDLLEEAYQHKMLSKKIIIEAGDKKYELDYNKMDAQYNISEAAKEAYNYGKKVDVINKYMLIKAGDIKTFNLSFKYNTQYIDEIIDKIEKEVKSEPVNARITVIKGNIKITPDANGVKLQREKLRQAIIEQINGELSNEETVIKAPVEITKPELTAEKLSTVNGRVSSFNTNFSTSTANRINNINLATKAIDGILLMPGESFSFNETVGQRTKQRGYKEAGVIVGDSIESGVGGGICQVSSTLYYTMLKANIKATERRNHSLPLSYIGKGLDATVDWGNIDFQFKNTLDYPIYIEGYVQNKNVYFNIYSNEQLTKRSYELATEVYDVVQPTIKYKDDPNMYEGESKVLKKSSKGYRVNVYRKTYENGKLVNTELISKDYYRVVNGEVLRGTKKKIAEES